MLEAARERYIRVRATALLHRLERVVGEEGLRPAADAARADGTDARPDPRPAEALDTGSA